MGHLSRLSMAVSVPVVFCADAHSHGTVHDALSQLEGFRASEMTESLHRQTHMRPIYGQTSQKAHNPNILMAYIIGSKQGGMEVVECSMWSPARTALPAPPHLKTWQSLTASLMLPGEAQDCR